MAVPKPPPPIPRSPLTPTTAELLILLLYPVLLFLGTLFSLVHPSTRTSHYRPDLQSYDPAHLPSYFASKRNIFNVYFVKIGWVWTTGCFVAFVLTHPTLDARRTRQSVLRYALITGVWIAMTQWCFGASLIDRSFRWTGGQCRLAAGENEMSDAREAVTATTCRALGGAWAGGHDISGHVVLLILASAMLLLELIPAEARARGLRDTRWVRDKSGLVRLAATETRPEQGRLDFSPAATGAIRAVVAVAALACWMLLMTAAYFHTWVEKFTGLVVALAAVWAVYFLPRQVAGLREICGLPGV